MMPRHIRTAWMVAFLIAGALVLLALPAPAQAQGAMQGQDFSLMNDGATPFSLTYPTPKITFSVWPDEALSYPSNLATLPDEHTTIFPPAPGSHVYRFFAASSITGGTAGAVVLQTEDLRNFTFAGGYSSPVMSPPIHFTTCDPSYDSEFDENYAAPGSVVQDPTRPPGNLMMIYEAENHCPGGVWQQPFYATVGFARSSDDGKTWPQPVDSEFGGVDRYPVLKVSAPEPAAEPTPANMGDALPSAFVDGRYLYVAYDYAAGPGGHSDGMIRVARAYLDGDDQGFGWDDRRLSFSKWYNGAFSEPGIGGEDSAVLPSRGCDGFQTMPGISYIDDLGLYLMTFVCVSLNQNHLQYQAAWYFSTATSLELQNWTGPQMIENSQYSVAEPCPPPSLGGTSFDGWYPSFMSPRHPAGHISRTGHVFFMNGCDAGLKRAFMSRTFTITTDPDLQEAPHLP